GRDRRRGGGRIRGVHIPGLSARQRVGGRRFLDDDYHVHRLVHAPGRRDPGLGRLGGLLAQSALRGTAGHLGERRATRGTGGERGGGRVRPVVGIGGGRPAGVFRVRPRPAAGP